MTRGRILAIDDEKNIRHLLRNELTPEGFEVQTAKTGEEGLKLLGEQRFDLVLLDIRLPKMDGIEVLRRLKQKAPGTEVIMITGYGDIKTAVESMKLGARDYITKPFKLSELIALISQFISPNGKDQASGRPWSGASDEREAESLACPSAAMREVYDQVSRVAATDVTVLIKGETGVGKEVLATRIHLQSHRKDKPFVAVDCGLLNENLAGSELYGHSKGAFSGATELRHGLVEKSDGGTIFFDEIGNIGLEMQKKFLRFLETKKFRRVGETKEREVDTRIVLATNLDLADAAQKGTMRKDLLFRMDVICIRVPPLRERSEDIVPLAQHFLELSCIDRQPRRLSNEAMSILTSYVWPGNVRELRSVMTKAMLFSRSDLITAKDLPAHLHSVNRSPQTRPKSLEDMEREHILRVLEETGGNQSLAAQILGINRKTLYKKIHKLQLFA